MQNQHDVIDPSTLKLDAANLPLYPLKKDDDGMYPFPKMPCGVLPFYMHDQQIMWGCVESNRVGPLTVTPPAGTQDIIAMNGTDPTITFTFEAGKRFKCPEGLPFLKEFNGRPFSGKDYQDIVSCLFENNWTVYLENPLVTAIHETKEEHGVDLAGRDARQLDALFEFPPIQIQAKRGMITQAVWAAQLHDIGGVELLRTDKIEDKIDATRGQPFYEQGCWGTLEQFKQRLHEQQLTIGSSAETELTPLVRAELLAFGERIKLIEGVEDKIKQYHQSLTEPASSASDRGFSVIIQREIPSPLVSSEHERSSPVSEKSSPSVSPHSKSGYRSTHKPSSSQRPSAFSSRSAPTTPSHHTSSDSDSPSSSYRSTRPRRRLSETWAPTAYSRRYIIGNDPVSTWDKDTVQKEHLATNRILQPAFLRRSAIDVVDDAKLTKQEWLTNFVCPTTKAAISIEVAAQLVVRYKVDPDDLAEKTQEVCDRMNIEAIAQSIDGTIQEAADRMVVIEVGEDLKTAKTRLALSEMKKTGPQEVDLDPVVNRLEAFERVLEDKRMKMALSQHIERIVPALIEQASQDLHIDRKQLGPETPSRVLLGAPASGKSKLLAQDSAIEKDNYVVISTDVYRGVSCGVPCVAETPAQVFLQTQDSAYMIRERVDKLMSDPSITHPILFDGVSYAHRVMNEMLATRSFSVQVACLGEADQIAPRAESRAMNSDANDSDKGRHVNTTGLLKSHAQGSKRLLENLPAHHNITLVNTNVQPPKIMAEIDSIDKKITIMHLGQASHFLGKQNLNEEATSSATLYYKKNLERQRFQYKPMHLASAILSMIAPYDPNKPAEKSFDVVLQNQAGIEYAQIRRGSSSEALTFTVLDQDAMIQFLKANQGEENKHTIDVLKELVTQTSKYKEKEGYLGRDLCQELALNDLLGKGWNNPLSVPKF